MRARARQLALLAVLGTAGAFAACTLNPQPLPPSDLDNEATFGDASTSTDAGSFNNPAPETPPAQDAGTGAVDGEGGAGGDAGDGGGDGGLDAGDAGADADAG